MLLPASASWLEVFRTPGSVKVITKVVLGESLKPEETKRVPTDSPNNVRSTLSEVRLEGNTMTAFVLIAGGELGDGERDSVSVGFGPGWDSMLMVEAVEESLAKELELTGTLMGVTEELADSRNTEDEMAV